MYFFQNTIKNEGSAHRTGKDIFLQDHYSEAGIFNVVIWGAKYQAFVIS